MAHWRYGLAMSFSA